MNSHKPVSDPEWSAVLTWIQHERHSVRFLPSLVDITGDLVTGLLFSQALYWFSRSDTSKLPRVKVKKEGRYWLAKRRTDWWNECRITTKQVDRALRLLETKGLIELRNFKFHGSPTTHLTICWPELLTQIKQLSAKAPAVLNDSDVTQSANSMLPSQQHSNGQNGNVQAAQTGSSLTYITPENTSQITTEAAVAAKTGAAANLLQEKASAPEGASADTPPELSIAERVSLLLSEWKKAVSGEISEADNAAANAACVRAAELGYPAEQFTKRFVRGAGKSEQYTISTLWTHFEYVIGQEAKGLKLLRKRFPGTPDDRKVAWFLALWIEAFEDHFKRTCRLNKSDLAAADEALADFDQRDVEELVAIAENAWACPAPPSKGSYDRYFACRQAELLRDFFKHLERIRKELHA